MCLLSNVLCILMNVEMNEIEEEKNPLSLQIKLMLMFRCKLNSISFRNQSERTTICRPSNSMMLMFSGQVLEFDIQTNNPNMKPIHIFYSTTNGRRSSCIQAATN